MGSRRGAVLLRLSSEASEASEASDAGSLAFIPAEVATRLVTLTSLTPVPGAPPPVAGLALADGVVVAVLALGGLHEGDASRRGEPAVLCHVDGLDIALTGGAVVATGLFDVASDGESIVWGDVTVPLLDVADLHARAEAATWSSLPAADAAYRAAEADTIERRAGGTS